MAYGTIKVDTITFTDAGVDKSIAISGLVQNPTFTGNVTVTGTISGNTVQGQTVSGVTVTGTTAQFTSGTFVSLTGTTLQGTTATYTTGSFASLTGTTTSGTTANFVSGVFSTQISGVTVTGTTASFTSGNFTNISGGTHTITSGVFAAGTAANPSISFTSDPNTGIYSPGADQVAISTNGSRGLLINSDGVVSVGRADSAGTGIEIGAGATGNRSVVIDLIGDTTYSDYGLRLIRESTGANATSALVHRGTGELYMVAVDSAPLVFSTVNQERMRLDSSGRLGLGTSSPQTGILDLTRNGTPGTISTYRQFRIGLDTNGNYSGFISYGFAASGGSSGLILESLDNGAASKTIINPNGGNVGIGTTNPSSTLTVGGNPPTSGAIGAVGSAGGIALALSDNTNSSLYVRTASGGAIIGTDGGGLIRFATGGNNTSDEKARIDASGRLLVGTSTSFTSVDQVPSIFLASTNNLGGILGIGQFASTNYGAYCDLIRSDSGVVGQASGGAIPNNGLIGGFRFNGSDGSTFRIGATMVAEADQLWASGDCPTRLVFSTTADGASSPTERVRITSGGIIKAGTSGAYIDVNSLNHEIRNGNSTQGLIVDSFNASYAGTALTAVCNPAASTAYSFFVGRSGAGADVEFNLRGDGNAFADGSWTGGGADYAEYFEWNDGNLDVDDRRGIAVVLDGDKIRPALAGEDPIGVISGNPSVVGDAAWNKWSGKYLRDEFGTYIQEDYEVEDEDGNTVVQQRRKLNPAYDPDVEYISREERPEWDCVGLMGKLRIRKGQPTGTRWIKMRDISSTVEEWLVR